MNPLTTDRRSPAGGVLSDDDFRGIDAYWRRAITSRSACCIYANNALLREPLAVCHIKERLIGHCGTDPGQSFVWVHLNRLIKKYDLNAIYIAGPGHGAPATLANAYLEGRYSEVYPDNRLTRKASANSSNSFRFRAASAVTARRRRPGRSTRAANWGIACRTRSVPRSTIPICSSRW
jgi:xylulose-5-phosphate/fructose-6-phosphate phosphoketolase